MKNVTDELKQIIDIYSARFESISEQDFCDKPRPEKWSKKEVVGHLIDSAHNNLRRFIAGQYETAPPKIVYNQDFWATANGYQTMRTSEVITLWKLVNLQICRVLDNMIPPNYAKVCDTGKNVVDLHTLQWLAEDYVRHMKHHINQVCAGSFDIIYT